jgi:gas vesicle protein GvpL/GvpF/DnaJ-like protein
VNVDRRRAYLYAVIADEVEIDLDPVGIPDGSGRVTGVCAGGLTAVLTPYTGPPFERLARDDVLRCLVVHQAVIERVMAKCPVLPVKFGTVLESQDAAREALITFRPRLASVFQEISGAVEIDLSASWDLPAMFADIKDEPTIAGLAGVARAEDDPVSLATRIQAGKLVQEALERRRNEYRHRLVGTLGPLVRDMHPHPLPADDIVLNLAVLVDRTRLAEFDDAIDRLASEWEGRINFRYVGPLPPYSFATVVLGAMEPSEIASAVETLGLRPRATQPEVRAAYRQLAATYHPDRNPEDPTAADRFATLGAAYRVLSRYMEGQHAESDREDGSTMYDLTPERAGHTLLLEIAEDDSPAVCGSEVRHGTYVTAG